MTADLDQLTREELILRARELGAERPEVMTRVELRDEIVRLSEPDPLLRRRSRGWLGVARDLVASVVDAGLNMPGAAAAIRGDARPAEAWCPQGTVLDRWWCRLTKVSNRKRAASSAKGSRAHSTARPAKASMKDKAADGALFASTSWGSH